MVIKHHTQLTASKLAALWNTYRADTMGICILQHFNHTAEDEKTKRILSLPWTI